MYGQQNCGPCGGDMSAQILPPRAYQAKSNPIIDALMGDPREILSIVLAACGVGWIPLTIESLGVSKIAWLNWAMSNLWEGWQGILTPYVSDTIAAGTANVNLATEQNGPALWWTHSVRFPPINTVAAPVLVTDARRDRANNLFSFQYQIDAPMNQQDSISVLQFAHGLVAGTACLPFPMMDLSGTPQAVVGGATVTRTGTKTFTGEDDTVIVTGFGTETNPYNRQLQVKHQDVLADWVQSRSVLVGLMDRFKQMEQTYYSRMDSLAQGRPLPRASIQPAQLIDQQDALINAAKNSIGQKAYSYARPIAMNGHQTIQAPQTPNRFGNQQNLYWGYNTGQTGVPLEYHQASGY